MFNVIDKIANFSLLKFYRVTAYTDAQTDRMQYVM